MMLLRPAPAGAGGDRTVLADALPGAGARDVMLVTGYALTIALGAKLAISLPSTPVPVTGQTLAVLLGAIVLGSRRAGLGSALYLGGGLAGLPLFAKAGGATLGYVFGFVVAAVIVGRLADAGWDRTRPRIGLAMVIGNAVIYTLGVGYLMTYLHVDLRAGYDLGVQPFLVGDLVKILIAVGLVPLAWRAVEANR
jgi:biotin transport system substrate-specific component